MPSQSDSAENPETRKIEKSWQVWHEAMFRSQKRGEAPLAEHHKEFWQWVQDIPLNSSPRPFAGFWPRGGAKSTNVERAVVSIGARKKRRYCLYVCATQEQADDHVQNISTILSGRRTARFYPSLSKPALNRFGNVKGWRRNRLQTDAHFTIDALGLDTATRGIKIDDDRPDLIILDDLDNEFDSELVTDKKVQLLAKKVLPAGARNLAVIFVQNLIGPNTVAARLANLEEAKPIDLLHNRIISGPFPALEDFEYEAKDTGDGYRILRGVPTWEGQNLEVCQNYIDLFGISAFLSECQHSLEGPDGEMFSHIEYQTCLWEQVPELDRLAVWVDPAVTNTDRSDSQGIQADGRGAWSGAGKGKIYRLYSWEGRTSPQTAVRRAILKAVELSRHFNAPVSVGIETDQGGDTWLSVYREACNDLVAEQEINVWEVPPFKHAKAGAGAGPKAARAQKQVSAYDRGVFVHVGPFHFILKRAQRRFPAVKPYDLIDAGYWSMIDLLGGINRVGAVSKNPVKNIAMKTAIRNGYRAEG